MRERAQIIVNLASQASDIQLAILEETDSNKQAELKHELAKIESSIARTAVLLADEVLSKIKSEPFFG